MKISDATLGEIYLVNQSRAPGLGSAGLSVVALAKSDVSPASSFGFDLFVPTNSLGAVADKLIAAAKSIGGRACGWHGVRNRAHRSGHPALRRGHGRENIPLECGIESRAISYNKGCYIGQEVINRIHSVGHVNKELRGLRLANDLKTLPAKGDKLFHAGKEVGYVTSAVKSPALNANIALGYVRREANAPGTELMLRSAGGESKALVAEIPFVK